MGLQTGPTVGTAFLLTTAAGMATVLGGMVIFSKRLLSLANPRSLAFSLSLAAGVMLFISLVEIFNKSVEQFTVGIKTDRMSQQTADGHGWLLATVCFGIGILLIYAVDALVHWISPEHEDDHNLQQNLQELNQSFSDAEASAAVAVQPTPVTPGSAIDASPAPKHYTLQFQTPDIESSSQHQQALEKLDAKSKSALNRMGILSALAIGIHNIPEGIATYVGASQNSGVGFSLAIGIGLHNIPEGIAVAAPIYFATGSRAKGIMWCVISALAEPFGGVLAWVAIGDGMNPITEGALFGVVCGIMVCISVKELLPTAYKFANGKTHLIAWGMFIGMFIMVTSLIMFGYAGV